MAFNTELNYTPAKLVRRARQKISHRCFMGLMATALLACSVSQASTLTSITHTTGGGAGTGTFSSSISGSAVTITEGISGFDSFSGFEIILNVVAPPNTATVYNVTKDITNNTTSTIWTSYQVDLGCDASATAPPRGTVNCVSFFHAQLDQTNTTITATCTGLGCVAGTPAAQNNEYFTVSGMHIAPGQTLELKFALDTNTIDTGGETMFEYAGVAPEPASFTLSLGGCVLVTMGLWRKKKLCKTKGVPR